MEYLTTHEDDSGAEWDIKLTYTISPADFEFTPYRLEPYQIGGVESGEHWVIWEGYSEKEESRWTAEIFDQEADQ